MRAEAVEALPPAWVPTFPPRLEAATVGPAMPGVGRPGRARAQTLITGALLCAIAAVCTTLALNGQLTVEHLIGVRTAGSTTLQATTISSGTPTQPLLTFRGVSEDAAGSSIDAASYSSVALHGEEGSFLTYLPPGYASTASHYPVLYLLTGNDQSNTAFLQIGLQSQLDRLIAHHVIPSMIAVMIQGGPGSNNWRNQGGRTLRKLHSRSAAADRPHAADLGRAQCPRDRGRLDGRLRRDERRARQPLPLRGGGELAELLQRARRRSARRPADHRAARPARVHLRRRRGSHRQPRPRTRRSPRHCGAPARRPGAPSTPANTIWKRSKHTWRACSRSRGARCPPPAERRSTRTRPSQRGGSLCDVSRRVGRRQSLRCSVSHRVETSVLRCDVSPRVAAAGRRCACTRLSRRRSDAARSGNPLARSHQSRVPGAAR